MVTPLSGRAKRGHEVGLVHTDPYEATIPAGATGSEIVWTLSSGFTRVTVESPLTTQTAPAPTPIPDGPSPTANVVTDAPLGSERNTRGCALPANHTPSAAAWIEIVVDSSSPTGIVR
jgi:hypothetical protein